MYRHPPVKPGELFRDQYEIQGLLGSGGYAYVYRAYDFLFNRQVALKFIDHGTRADKKRRAKNEAIGLKEIDHPNVVRMYQAGIIPDGWTFIAMELLLGPSFRAVLDHYGRLWPAEILHLGIQVAEGLHAIHQAGVIHRDVKPDNVMLVGPDDRALVIDLGVAKFERVDAKTTQRRAVQGTIRYMCPEQLFGVGVSLSCDIYSFGTMLYEAAAGVLPTFVDLSPNLDPKTVICRQLTAKPPLLNELVPEVPSFMARTIHRMLGKQREERPEDMVAVVAALRKDQETLRAHAEITERILRRTRLQIV